MWTPLEHSLAEALPDLAVPARPAAFPGPELVLLNRELAAELGLDADGLHEHGAAWFAGGALPGSARTFAFAYTGHQFGHLAPRLGDGRAVLLGERVDRDGVRRDLQLKGSGRTPFSRGGDGRAALDSVLREYLMSEAMHALGVPTTRALAAVRTSDTVLRYRASPGGLLVRVARSHLRVGTLEYVALRDDLDLLRATVQVALERHHPHALDSDNAALALLESTGRAQVELVARWMHLGFIHGIMNTDNTSLSGETLDYGPCAFMERTSPDTWFSRVDEGGRYRYGHQPRVVLWNLARLAEALLPLIDAEIDRAVQRATDVLERLQSHYEAEWLRGMRAKLGLHGEEDGDHQLATQLFDLLVSEQRDYTHAFRELAEDLRQGRAPLSGAAPEWGVRWRLRLHGRPAQVVAAAMDAVNPLYIPRNHRVELALDAAVDGDLAPTRELLSVLTRPFERQPGREAYAEPAQDGGRGYWTHCNT